MSVNHKSMLSVLLSILISISSSFSVFAEEEEIPAEQEGPDIQETVIPEQEETEEVSEIIEETSVEEMTETAETEPMETEEEVLQETVEETAPEEFIEEELETELFAESTEDGYTWSAGTEGTAAITGYTGTDTELTIPAEIDGNTVTSISVNAFKNKTGITKVTLPEGMMQLYGSAFAGCTSLEEIVLPSTLTMIGDNCFNGCRSLKTVNPQEGIVTIFAYAFANCTSLEEIHLPDSVTKMGYQVFLNDKALKTVNYPKNYDTSIGGYGAYDYQYGQLFAGCTSLETVTIPEGTETIANYALSKSHIKTIQIPDSVTLISSYAFSECAGLTEISVPGSVAKIDTYAFSGCTSLTDVTLNEGLTQLQGFAFSSCTGLEEIELPSTMGYVGDHNFYGCTNLKRVTIPEDLKTIYAYAFANCTSLEEIHLPDSVTTMGYRVFANDTALKTVNYPKSYNSSIDGYGAYNYEFGQLFFGCTSLETVTIPEGTETIANYAFRNSNITSIQIPESVTLIGSYAFSACTNLSEVSIPESVAKIDTYAFSGCTSLTDVTLNEGLTQLQGYVFSGCTALEEITMPVSLSYVGDHAFSGCINLKNVSLQEGMGTIFAYAFENCTSLEEIHLPDSVTKMGYRVFANDTALKTVNYPKNYSSSIDGYGATNYEFGQLFYGCTSLETVLIPDGTQKIADYAFRNSSISKMFIPRSVTAIGNYAFDGCTKLTDVYYQIDEENWNKISIGSVNDILTRVTMHYNTGTVDPAELVPVISASYNELIPVGTEVKFKGSAAAADSVISSWTWDFGDEHTETGKSVVHTFETGGNYTVKLTIKDILGRQYSSTAEYKAIDFNAETQGYTWIRWSVINGTDNSAVSGAEISLGTAEGEELYRFTSDSSGLAEKIIPEGRYQVTVIRQNYMPRSFEFEFEGGICERTLPMYQASILTGNITVRELTYDEIIAAGIDISVAGNGQVYAFKTQMFFKAGLKEYEIDFEFIKDPDGKILKKPEKVKLWIEAPDTEPDDDPDHPLGPGTYMPIPGGGYYIIAYPMTEKFALILTGEAHWLKEMFQVQLAVANPSFGSALDDISAELQLPAGMSLAEMTWGEQSAEQTIGMLMPGQSANTSWYIRGDAEGDYNIKAKVTGTDLEFNEAFEQNFETTDPIHVYAGSALHMTISCPDVAERGKPYTVKYRLENVSEKPVYDLTFGITGAEQYKIIGYGNQQAWLPITDMDFGEECTKHIDVLAPGGSFEFAVETTIWFNSALELIEFTKLGAYVDVVYYLDNVSQMTLSGSTTEIPYDFVVERTERDSFIDWVIDVAADEILGDLFPSGNLGGTMIEIVGDSLGLRSWMIKGSKTLLKLWQGSTEYVITVSIDDGLGNENSIENDVVRITAGDGVSSVVDALNHNGFKISAREIQIEAKIPGSTTINIGIEDKYGNIQSEYTYDVIVDGHEVAKTVTVTPTGTTREYVVDEYQMTEATKDVTNELRDIYKKNPFLWIKSTMEYKVDAQTDDTKGSYQIRFFNDDKSGGGALWTKTHNNIEISSTTATLDFTRKSWQKIAEESGEEFTIIAKRLTEDEAEQLLHTSDPVYQFVVESDGKHITDFEDSVYVTVPYELTDPDNAEDIYVEHFNDDGTSEILNAIYDSETKTVSFGSSRFSYFRIIQLDPSERTLTLNKNALELFKNGTEQLNVLEDVNVTWTSDHPEIASVSEDGTITAVSAGTAVITVTSADGTRTAACKVTVLPSGIYVRESADSYLFTGTAIKPEIEVYDTGTLLTEKTDYTITYKNNIKAYTIKEGEEGFSAKKAPQIIIKAKGDYSGTRTVYFTIDPIDITSSDIETLTTAYTGKVQKLSPTVVYEGKTLKKGTDYTLEYPSEGYSEPGTYDITVTGIGNYTGTRTYQMTIGAEKQISLDKASVTLEKKSYGYQNGEPVRPNIKTVNVGKTVVDPSLYTVSYGENNTVGNGTVTITGNDSETIGTRTVTFKITGTKITTKLISVTVLKSVTRGTDLKTAVTISTDLTEGTDYEVTYPDTENAGKATIVITGINGFTGTIKKTVTVSKDTLTADNTAVSVPETVMIMKNGAKPIPEVTFNGTELAEGIDYTLSYANNKKAGTGTVTVKGKGNYAGSVKQTFTISTKNLSETTLEFANNVNSSTKKGSYKTTVVIRDEDGGVLKANTDYTLKFYDGDAEIPATASANDYLGKTLTVKASGKGNYTGEDVLSSEYTVVDSTYNLAKASISIKPQQYQSGKPVEITSTDQFSKAAMGKNQLTLGTDFKVYAYSNNVNRGTATVVFLGIEEYSGYKSVTYKIGQRTLKDHWEGIVSFFSSLIN